MPKSSIPKYPDVKVCLTGSDGNAFMIIGAVSKALRKAHGAAAVEAFRKEATAGDYNHVIQTAMEWVDVS